jgi:hypothetical protein
LHHLNSNLKINYFKVYKHIEPKKEALAKLFLYKPNLVKLPERSGTKIEHSLIKENKELNRFFTSLKRSLSYLIKNKHIEFDLDVVRNFPFHSFLITKESIFYKKWKFLEKYD